MTHKFKKFLLFVFSLVNFYNSSATIEYLDTTFGSNYNGTVSTVIGTTSQVNGITTSNGQLLVAGTTTINGIQNAVVVRYNSNGTLDTTFGSTGIITFLSGTSSTGNAVVVDTSNRIVVAGSSSSTKILLARFNTNGSPDLTFGTGGIATFTISSNTGTTTNGAVIDANGKIVVCGTTILSGKNNLFAARFNTNGSIDTTFNTTGFKTLTASTGYTANSVKIDLNAKIVLGGSAQTSSTTSNFLVARLNTNGTVDTTFGTSGVTTTTISGATVSVIKSIAIDSSDRVVVGGSSGSSTATNFTVGRYKTTGVLDTTFGTNVNGIQITPIGSNSQANAVAIDLNGQIVGSGFSGTENVTVRYNVNGSLDTTFGFGGIFTNQIGTSSQINSIVIQPTDGRIVSGGNDNSTGSAQFSLQRYNKNNTDFINVNSIVANSNVNTKIPVISGISSGVNATVQVYINGTLFNTVSTDGLGNWDAGNTNVLPIGNNVVKTVLLSGSNVIVSEAIQFNVVDNLAEDSVFAYGTQAQTSTSSTYSAVPFNNLVRLGTWSYSNSVFTCNKSGTYLIEYVSNGGLTGTVGSGTTSVDVATAIGINNVEYLGSEADASIDLNANFTRTLTRSFMIPLNAGQTIDLKFAVNIVGAMGGFNPGLVMSPNALGNQPVYSLAITRIG